MDYLGKKINVTTSTGYQYEGILTKVDAEDATIELQMVRRTAFNGKPETDSKVYEYVVFKSDDIVDLYIYQTAVPDPAIVSEKPLAAKKTHEDHGDWLDPQFPSVKKQTVQSQREIQFGAAPTNQPITFGSVGFASAVSGTSSATRGTASTTRPVEQQTVVVNSETITSRPTSFAAAAAASSSVAPTFAPTTTSSTSSKQQQSTPKIRSYSTVTKQITQVESTSSDHLNRPKHREPVIPNKEFDFEQANQRFDKDQIAAEVAPVINTDVPFYQKSSFFDNISSETKVPEERNRTERSWNIETFGQPFVRGSNPGHRGSRGGQRGGQQRGGARSMHRNATGSFQ